ncbi:MAG: aldose epimerase family protein [Polyangia bacterium]|jgi:aldose 1-epimerase
MQLTDTAPAESEASIDCVPFGKAPDGTPVDLYRLTNRRGLVATITNYGGIVVSLLVPDRDGKLGDVVLGYDTLAEYIAKSPYFGCLVGRYGNRIARGEFTLDGRTYSLAKNDGENHLHGGRIGFDKVVWSAKPLPKRVGSPPAMPAPRVAHHRGRVGEAERSEQGGGGGGWGAEGRSEPSQGSHVDVGLQLQYLSKDGEEGYPGALAVGVTYTLSDQDEFIVDYLATTDKPTVVNLTHHSYFNLDGADGDTLGHLLTINADSFTPVDSGLIPTGEVRAVKGTPMDFTRPKAVGADLPSKDPQLVIGHGYDHNWVLRKNRDELSLAASLAGPRSGRVMEILTTEPGIQFYGGGWLDGTIVGKQGQVYGPCSGLCLETQHYPNSPNQAEFPPTVLRPGETFRSRTVHRFSVAQR